MGRRYIVAITGASGVLIGKRLTEILAEDNLVYSIVSEGAKKIARCELKGEIDFKSKNVVTYGEDEIDRDISSGTCRVDGMVIAPCSMKTLSAIAHGYSSNLITRAADVCIKERRRLVIVPREVPFSQIHLENLLKLSMVGVDIVPPLIQFYSAETIDQMVDYICGKVLDRFGLEHGLYKEWA
jgi:4-hydroxy-3-polyprenylbenzoate decarboxylase